MQEVQSSVDGSGVTGQGPVEGRPLADWDPDAAAQALPQPAGTISEAVVLPPSGYVSRVVRKGQTVRLVDIFGQQVADIIALAADDTDERFWITNTIRLNKTVFPTLGHTLYSELSRPMLTITEDTCRRHDLLAGSCNAEIDAIRWPVENHRGCVENLAEALAPWGLRRADVPNSMNVFMNCLVEPDGSWRVDAPLSEPGDCIDFRADMDLIVAVSNCPQDLNACNGGSLKPLGFMIYEPAEPSPLPPFLAHWARAANQ